MSHEYNELDYPNTYQTNIAKNLIQHVFKLYFF